MPVYVTRAHVTLGDPRADKAHRSHDQNLASVTDYSIKELFHTPCCFSTCLATLVGLMIILGGCLMTVIGYKPDLFFGGKNSLNDSNTSNFTTTNPTSVPNNSVDSKYNHLKWLTYVGSVFMGIGFFVMMMSIVLFCEIKDRYYTSFVKNRKVTPREDMYDNIIKEFRKHYFRGIEVPLTKKVRRRSSLLDRIRPFLSRSVSSCSSRRYSLEIFRKKKRPDMELSSERVPNSKRRRSTLKRILDRDTWLKTSSLPNIRHRDNSFELKEMFTGGKPLDVEIAKLAKSCDPRVGDVKTAVNNSGIDNPGYKESPQHKRKLLMKGSLASSTSCESPGDSKHVTQVDVHRASQESDIGDTVDGEKRGTPNKLSNPDNENKELFNVPPTVHCGNSEVPNILTDATNNEKDVRSNDTVIDIDRDIIIAFADEDEEELSPSDKSKVVKQNSVMDLYVCTCPHDKADKTENRSLRDSTSSDGSSSLSWDDVPRNSRKTDNRTTSVRSCKYKAICHGKESMHGDQVGNPGVRIPFVKSMSSFSARDVFEPSESDDSKRRGPYRTCAKVIRSDSCIPKMEQRYSLLWQYDDDNLSVDSLDLTDDNMKNFEMAEMAYI